MLHVGPDERDAVGEVFNIAIGNAARALSETVGEPVNLSAPVVDFYRFSDMCRQIDEAVQGDVAAVREAFTGPFNGSTYLIFPETKSLELVSRLIGEENADLETFSEMEQDALLEVGNIVLTSCIASIADLLELKIDQASLPEMRTGTGSSIFDETDCDDSDQENILFLQVDFGLQGQDISGYVIVILNLSSVESFRALLRNYIESLTGENA